MMEKILSIQNLVKYYGKTLGVENVCLDIYEGEILGLIGPNGAGKSTTLRAVMNLINKTEGQVYFKNVPLTKDRVDLKKDIGYLPSEIYLYEEMTVKEMLDYHESFYEQIDSKYRKKLVKKLKIDEFKKIEDLSLGNLKKLGIVLAMMHKPKLLILDEPTSGLDPVMQEVFFELLKEINREGTTILYSTHVLSEISKLCNRVGIIKDGKLIKVEDIKMLATKNLTNVTISSRKIEDIIKKLNVKYKLIDQFTIKFNNDININELITLLSAYQLDSLLIEEASLEEVLMNYYK